MRCGDSLFNGCCTTHDMCNLVERSPSLLGFVTLKTSAFLAHFKCFIVNIFGQPHQLGESFCNLFILPCSDFWYFLSWKIHAMYTI